MQKVCDLIKILLKSNLIKNMSNSKVKVLVVSIFKSWYAMMHHLRFPTLYLVHVGKT